MSPRLILPGAPYGVRVTAALRTLFCRLVCSTQHPEPTLCQPQPLPPPKIQELIADLEELCTDKFARLVLLYMLTPRNTRYVHPAHIKTLTEVCVPALFAQW